MDTLGRVISESPPDEYSARCGIGNALGKISPYLKKGQVLEVFKFFVPDGLNDRNAEVRQVMLQAATAVIDNHGKVRVNNKYFLELILVMVIVRVRDD